MHDTKLRETYARIMASRGNERRDCPSAEVIQTLATAAVHDERSALTFDHVMGCEACVAEYELLRSVHVAGKPGTPVQVRRWAPLALAASALLAVGIATTMMRDGDRMRGVVGAGPAGVVEQVRRGDSLRLTWSPVTGADAYRVEVLDLAGDLLGDATTGDTTVALAPETVPAGVAELEWLVVTRRADGNEQRSPLRRVRVVP